MEVLFRGKTSAEKQFVVSCYACKSIIKYNGLEIVKTSCNQRDGVTHYLGECPVCKAELINYNPKENRVP